MQFRRYALYYMPPPDAAWSRTATAWLGWDANSGQFVPHPDWSGLPAAIDEVTATPRRYGLHATIKPPFFLAPGCTSEALAHACDNLCRRLAPVALDGLSVERLGRFVALRPVGDETALNALAAACVEGLDGFRAPLTEAELARRRAAGLTADQDATLLRWGYPYVMQQFRFHITLTGRLAKEQAGIVQSVLKTRLEPLLPKPFRIADLGLSGEDEHGRFHLIHRFALSASSTSRTA